LPFSKQSVEASLLQKAGFTLVVSAFGIVYPGPSDLPHSDAAGEHERQNHGQSLYWIR
jgi:hypothetical protein